MLKFKTIIVTCIIFSACVGNAQAEIKTKNLGKGWTALTQQTDPFDSSKIEVIQIIKGSFIYRCNELNMNASSYGYESLSFKADL